MTRTEVLEKLGWTDIGLFSEQVFIGSWKESTRSIRWLDGEQMNGTARKHVTVEFDEAGRSKQFHTFSDGSAIKEITAWVRRTPNRRLHLSLPIQIHRKHEHRSESVSGTLTLYPDRFEWQGDSSSHNFTLPVGKVVGFNCTGWFRELETGHTLRFSETPDTATTFSYAAHTVTLPYLMIRYWEQTKAPLPLN